MRERDAHRSFPGFSLSAPADKLLADTAPSEYKKEVEELIRKVKLAEKLFAAPLEPVYSQMMGERGVDATSAALASVPTESPRLDRSRSQQCGLKRCVLDSIGTGICSTFDESLAFVRSTLWASQRPPLADGEPDAVRAVVTEMFK